MQRAPTSLCFAQDVCSQPGAAGEYECDLAWPVVEATSTTRRSDGSAAALHASKAITRGAKRRH